MPEWEDAHGSSVDALKRRHGRDTSEYAHLAAVHRMNFSASRIAPEFDLDREGKQQGFLRIPHSVHRSAYGWLPMPVVTIRNGEGLPGCC